MDIWYKILCNTININSTDADYIIKSKNRWEDVYRIEYYNKLISNEFVITHFFFSLLDNDSKTKIQFWNETVGNMFYSQEQKEELWNKYIKTQKKYYILSKFVSICKYKYTNVKVDTDLNLDKIVLQPHKSIQIYHDGALYYFTINDLINLCHSSLTFSYQFFSEAYTPKNPYTNNYFTYPILLKIYFSIRHSYFKMPVLFEMFYRSNFNIKYFKKVNDFLIREECIKSFMKNACEEDMCEYIDEMLAIKEYRKLFTFEAEFPKDILIKAFKPYVFLFIISRYSLRSSRKLWEYKVMLKKTLRKFKQLNPAFGRCIYKFERLKTSNPNKTIRRKHRHFITEFNEGSITASSFREFIIDNMFKDDCDSDEECDEDNASVLGRIYVTLLNNSSIHPENSREQSIVVSDDENNTEVNVMNNNLNIDISSDDENNTEVNVMNNNLNMDISSDDDSIIIRRLFDDTFNNIDDELNDTDSMS
jgi:hypothetical protein